MIRNRYVQVLIMVKYGSRNKQSDSSETHDDARVASVGDFC